MPECRRGARDGSALRDLDPALADDLVACRLDIGYPAAPASATRAYAALAERLGASSRHRWRRRGSRSVTASPSVSRSTGVSSRPGRVVVAGRAVDSGRPDRGWRDVAAVAADPPLVGRRCRDRARAPAAPRPRGDRHRHRARRGGDAAARRDDAGFGFSLVTADGSSALGSTFLPEPPEPSSVVDRLRDRRRPLRAGDRVDAGRRAADVRPPGQPRRPAAPRPDPGDPERVRRRGPRAVGDLDRPGLGPTGRGSRAGKPRRDPGGARPGSLRGARRGSQEPLAPAGARVTVSLDDAGHRRRPGTRRTARRPRPGRTT